MKANWDKYKIDYKDPEPNESIFIYIIGFPVGLFLGLVLGLLTYIIFTGGLDGIFN
jgi:hypothetical protein